ncbi:PREDICTED: uncharacterized protein LOC107070430 [Polistes dominula]|uniref:Uncharacterized protein LOC107070430 n=1 Tax=Polistes dominula TaxID=743375 RepID=A0ABM1IV83_POLDO|nr:PREDICTED: uncharacterized protein LOC107070430 [Polistes dominula]
MQQTEKNKTQKYTNGPTPSWSAKYQTTNVRDSSNANWKYVNKHNLSVPSNKNNRKQLNATAEPITSYYSSMNSYKQNKHNNYESPTHTKYTTFQNIEPHRWTTHNHPRTTPRNKLYATNNNIAIVRKSIYKKNDLEDDDENVRYAADEELGNLTEDNVEEDTIEEVEDDQEETAAESVDKDYEEHEADDEIDEESDSTVLISQKWQRRPKKDGISQEQQRSRIIKQQQFDPRKLRYQQYVQNSYDSHPRIRYYNDLDDQDEIELYTYEEPVRPPTPPKSSIRRSRMNHQQHWTTPFRSSSDRYDTNPSLNQSIRRSQPKKDVEDLLHSENKNTKKCIRCGAPSGSRLSTKTKKNVCRFQEYPDYIVKESFGDDMDAVEKILCGRCNINKHNYEDIEGSYRSARSTLQTLKPRRSKGSKGISEVSEDFPINEEIPNDYINNRYSRDPTSSANTVHDKTRHSTQTTTRGPTRSFSRYGTQQQQPTF